MITEINTKEIYDIAGLTPLAGGYEFTFPYTSAQDVRVYTTGNKTDTEVSTSNYTIDKSGATPKVVFISGYNFPAGQTKLTIIRSVSYSQELDLRNGDLIDADKLEGALDDITQQIQQVAEKIDRAILSSVSDTAPLSIPEASQRSNMLLGFDDEGKVIPVLTTDIEQKLAQALAAEESAIIAKNAAENAQHEAESAQSAAETAQEMAETAQAAAESAETSSQAILVSISTKTEEAIASINTTKTGAVGAVTTQQATSVAAVQAAQNTAESDIAGKRASALTAIDTAKTNAVAAVNTQKETSVAAADREIVAKRDSALTDIQTARTNAVNAITTQKDTSVQEVEQLASERKAEINSLAANQKADVKQYTDGVVASAKTEIDTEKTTAVTAVQEEGDAKVAEIVSSGDAEVTRVQSVYQTDLNELKGDLDDIATEVKPENIFDKDTMAVVKKWYIGEIGSVANLSDAAAYSAIKIPVSNIDTVSIKQNLEVGNVGIYSWFTVDSDMVIISKGTPQRSIKNGYTITGIDGTAKFLLLSLLYYEDAIMEGNYLSVVVGSTAKDYSPYFEPYLKVKIADGSVTENKIADGSVTPQKTSFMELKHGENLFDWNTMTYENKWYTDFTVGSKASKVTLDSSFHDVYIAFEIPLYKAEPFYIHNDGGLSNVWAYALLDADGTVLVKDTSIKGISDGIIVSDVPSSAVKFVGTIQYWKDEIVDSNHPVMVGYGTTYKDYTEYIPDWYELYSKTAENALSIANSAIIATENKRSVMYIMKEDNDTQLLIKMKETFDKGNVDVIFEKATYTLSDAYDYIRNTLGKNWTIGLPIGNGCRYFFNDSTIISNPPSDGYSDSRNILDCQAIGSDYEIHDVTLINNGGRYCIHDEGNSSKIPYCHKYENVVMIYNKTELTPDTGCKAFGCGTGFDASLSFDGCVFIHNNGQNVARLAIHAPTSNPNNEPYRLHFSMKNCYFDEGSVHINQSLTPTSAEDGNFVKDVDTLECFLFGNSFGSEFNNISANVIENNNTIRTN